MQNSTRTFVKIINEICYEEKIEIESFSYDWIFRLCKDEKFNYIMGYQFGLNTASVNSICCDKCAASEIMSSFKIPNVEHSFFMSPTNQKYISKNGNWEVIADLLNKYHKIVCKSNEGSGGNNIYCVTNKYELEHAVHKIFSKSRSMAICPYYDIENEYRTIILDGELKLIYSKQRQYIVGDGIKTIKDLLLEYLNDASADCFKSLDKIDVEDFDRILDLDEKYFINWKHNLGQGAKAIIETNEDVVNKITTIVKDVSKKMNIKFASIDIVKCPDSYRVLEINSGVMMEHFAQQDESSYQIAKSIYKQAILKMFN